MNTPIRYPILSVVLLALLMAPVALAQHTVDGRFQRQIKAGAGTGGLDQLEVTLELAAASTYNLGSAVLMFTYNDAALALPSAPPVNGHLAPGEFLFLDPYVNDPDTGTFYASSTVTVFGEPGRLSANLVLDLAGFGQPLPEAFTPVVKVFFDIIDAAQPAELAWIVSGDPNPTEVTEQDNTTLVALGSFSDAHGPLPVAVEAAVEMSEAYRLTAPYPNPARDAVHFSLAVQHAQRVEVVVYDLLGRRVQTLFAGTLPGQAARAFDLDGAGLPSGLYVVRAEGETFMASRRFVLAR